LLALALAAAAQSAAAEDLLQVFRDAQRYDATYAAARNNLAAGRERLPQGRALILPTLNLSANATRSRIDTESRDATISPSFLRNPDSSGYTLTLTQPLFRAQNFLQYQQSEFQVRQAEATFGQAAQDLIVRLSQAYFDVLGQYDTLILVRAQKAATSEQLAQAKRNFEVGTATITDTHEAQARYDLIAAQEIAALNDLQARRRQLQLITGKEYTELKQLRGDVRLSPPNPENVETWADLAEKQSYTVLIQEAGAEVALLESKRANAGHLPTLDFVAQYGQTAESASTTSSVGRDTTNSSVGLQFALPLFQGGSVSSRARETAALYQSSKDSVDNARRTAVLTARQLYLSTLNGITQVAALEQARVSSQSALDSGGSEGEQAVQPNGVDAVFTGPTSNSAQS
jgi:outer membrane protein